jgi:hypothetical protein
MLRTIIERSWPRRTGRTTTSSSRFVYSSSGTRMAPAPRVGVDGTLHEVERVLTEGGVRISRRITRPGASSIAGSPLCVAVPRVGTKRGIVVGSGSDGFGEGCGLDRRSVRQLWVPVGSPALGGGVEQ